MKSNSHIDRLQSSIDRLHLTLGILHARRASVGSNPCKVASCLVEVRNPNGGITDDTDSESYLIDFNDEVGCSVSCATVYGCMHGMQTFIQLVDPLKGYLMPSSFRVEDKPEFSYRGLLLDTGRRFLPPSLIIQNIEMLAATKMNVLHWHISDDQSFPIELACCPRLSQKGAFSARATYSKQDMREIVEYAALRGVRVIPELDIPGHTDSWLRGYPELLGIAKSAIDPTREENYVFLEKMLREVADIFDSNIYEGGPVIHLGGDETDDGWDTPAMREWMAANGMKTKADLISVWVSRMSGIAEKLGFKIIMWDDFLGETNMNISKFGDESNPIVWQSWRHNFTETANMSRALNRRFVFSTDFYLDHLDDDWVKFYSVLLDETNKGNLIGGEACMWGEWVDESNLFARVWPRAAAVAERLWCGLSRCEPDVSVSAAKRLAKWRCRMKELFGYANIEPIGPIQVRTPDQEMRWHTDKEGWYCAESDLDKEGAEELLSYEYYTKSA